MQNNFIGNLLKTTRKKKGVSIKDATNKLATLFDIHISNKTLYGWEAGRSEPNIKTFLAMCQLYDITNKDLNSLGFFFYEKSNYFSTPPIHQITSEEIQLLTLFRNLTVEQKNHIHNTIDIIGKNPEADSKVASFVARNSGNLELTDAKQRHLTLMEKKLNEKE